ncbi:hypothetical protein [Cohnella herbarum]|uniref:Uncharacterized protein n=1 Tax=Cohnella herbarum TaxID=2728023 RepID=A0A7Z2VJD6_9BACL|nr:hypothetical protein [Cohnella herbarum]QJD83969.1 hypothetical protein HH215_12775 [Cohnella herbarum]
MRYGKGSDDSGILLGMEYEDFVASIDCGRIGSVAPEVSVAYPRTGMARVRLSFRLDSPVAQADWSVTIRPAFQPVFHWSPHLTPTDEHVVDQHSFRSPALIAHDGQRMITMIPDLDAMMAMPLKSASGDAKEPRWYMDLNAPRNELVLGLSATEVREHVLYVRKPGTEFPSGALEFGFYLAITADQEQIANPWRGVLDFLWNGWGGRLYAAGQPLAGSLEPYVQHAYEWAFRRWEHAVWQQFELEGRDVGAPAFIVNVQQSPNYPGVASEREFRSIWNQAWFSSLRSAQGLYRYGKRIGNDEYVRRAMLAKELALAAPQRGGLFPSVIATEMDAFEENGTRINRSRGWDTKYWGNSNRNPFTRSAKESPYHILDMSWTALLMLRWHDELETDARLIDYAASYAEALLPLQDERGFFPGWIDPVTLKPCGILDDSPETSMSVTFLLKLYELTKRETFLDSALLAMKAVTERIVPEGRWEDFETYYSCSSYGHDHLLGRKAERNNMYKQCNFSMFWTAEALLECYLTTRDSAYLQLGRRCLDEMLMTQASWQPPYIFVPALGGFGVMNVDGEWNDSRQSLFAEIILRYGKELGVEEYVQRGIAAMRASFVLMYCPENPEVKARWEQAWPFFGERDYGFMMENYGHGGRTHAEDDYMGDFTIFDWGNGAAAESYMRLTDHYGESLLDQADSGQELGGGTTLRGHERKT